MKHFLADRISALPASATITMNQLAIDLQAQGNDIINLSIGEPDFKTPLPIQQAAKQAIDSEAYFSYTPVAGYADLRAAIADKLHRENNIRCEPTQIVVSNGAKQAIANVLLCLLNPGDEVVVYTPYWVSYVAIIQLAGGKPVLIRGKQANNFEATPEQLDQAITSTTKAVIFSSPCNPTGNVFAKQALEAMATVLAKHPHVFVIADEIYEINIRNAYLNGMLYELSGNTATNFQFYVTDNKKHFLRGALYFNVRTNTDSIAPALEHLKADVLHMLETLRWN